MKIGLFGFGRTGRAVAQVLMQNEDMELAWVARRSAIAGQDFVDQILGVEGTKPVPLRATQGIEAGEFLDQSPVDYIVDFSSADGIHYYGEAAAKRGIVIASAISQYPWETMGLLKRLSGQTRVLHSPNITLGVNFLIIASKILKNIYPESDIAIIEEHFRQKPEVSGTARIIAEELDIESENIKSIRAGGIIGTHEVLFGFPHQTVRIKHESINRQAFGNGMSFALRNLPKQKNGLFSMEDILLPMFNLGASEEDFGEMGKKPWWRIW